MKNFKRILAYAGPFGYTAPAYFIFAILTTIFGMVNLGLIIPLFDLVFDQLKPTELAQFRTLPVFSFSQEFLKGSYYYYVLQFIDEYGKLGALTFVASTLVAANLLSNLFKYLSFVIIGISKVRITQNLRNQVYQKLGSIHIGYFNNEKKGDLLSRMTSDVSELEIMVMYAFQIMLKEPIAFIFYMIFLFTLSWKLTLFTLIILPIAGVLISSLSKKLKAEAKELQQSSGRILNIIEETISGMRIIKAFTAQKYMANVFGKEHRFFSKTSLSFIRKQELASPISEVLGVIFVAGILLYGGYLVLEEQIMSSSAFMAYLIVFSQAINPAKEIGKAISFIQKGLAASERVFELLDTEEKIIDQPNAIIIDGLNEKITFDVKSFAYDKESVLRGIQFDLYKGKTVALVGPSGGGKSTLADLLPRFYDVKDGNILWDDRSLNTIQKQALRSQIGVVTQESILFNDTIFNNIAFGIPDTKPEEVERAAKIANAHDFIIEMEDGYQTMVGERGSRLSGGQRQRLSIARAVLKNPPVLILDEATSALDTASERLVQGALNKLMDNRTALVIAHRLSTIKHADTILVIKDGEIIERGTHDELIQNTGLYKDLIKLQSQH